MEDHHNAMAAAITRSRYDICGSLVSMSIALTVLNWRTPAVSCCPKSSGATCRGRVWMSACWMALMAMLVMLQVMLMAKSRRHRHRVSSLDVATQNTDGSVLGTLADLERRRATSRSLGASATSLTPRRTNGCPLRSLAHAMITSRGELASFGWGSSGALGHGGWVNYSHGQSKRWAGREIVAVAVGGRHTVALESVTSSSALLARDYGALLTSGIDADVIIEAGLASTGGSRLPLPQSASCVPLPTDACDDGNGVAVCQRVVAMRALSRHHRSIGRLKPMTFARMASDPSFYKVALRLPSIRAPIFALLLRWIYTQRVDTVEPLFLSQLSRAARKLRMPALEQACQPNASSSPLPATLPSCLRWLLNDGAYAEDVKLIAIDGSLYASSAPML